MPRILPTIFSVAKQVLCHTDQSLILTEGPLIGKLRQLAGGQYFRCGHVCGDDLIGHGLPSSSFYYTCLCNFENFSQLQEFSCQRQDIDCTCSRWRETSPSTSSYRLESSFPSYSFYQECQRDEPSLFFGMPE